MVKDVFKPKVERQRSTASHTLRFHDQTTVLGQKSKSDAEWALDWRLGRFDSKSSSKNRLVRMLDEEISSYDDYESYLDSLVTMEDRFYLGNNDLARAIVELGYRSSGDTLTRDAFFRARARINNKKKFDNNKCNDNKKFSDNVELDEDKLEMDADFGFDDNFECKEADSLLDALTKRHMALRQGILDTVLFVCIEASDDKNGKTSTISAHIDLSDRIKRDKNLVSKLSKFPKQLKPYKHRDLSYCNLGRGDAQHRNSANFEVVIENTKMYLRHVKSDLIIDASPYSTKSLYPSSKVINSEYKCQGWKALDNSNKVFICDFLKMKEQMK